MLFHQLFEHRKACVGFVWLSVGGYQLLFQTSEAIYFLKWAIPGLAFFIFVFLKQLEIYKICQWRDDNCRPLVLEATALPTAPQLLPFGVNKSYSSAGTLCLLRHSFPICLQLPFLFSCVTDRDWTRNQRTLTYFVRDRITVWLTSCSTGFDSTKLVNLYLIHYKQSSWIRTSQTGGQPYSDTSLMK